MKTDFLIPLVSVLCAILFFCTPAPHETGESLQKWVPAVNARIWLAPFINSSNIASIEGWPDDSIQRRIIMSRFGQVESRLLSEMRRCEKYGLYSMVDDSSGASMIMKVTLEPFSREYDTVTIPVKVTIASTSSAALYSYDFKPRVPAYRDMREKNPYHYVGLIMMNFVNNFPYKTIAHLLYRSGK
jgi:hypothetical protein